MATLKCAVLSHKTSCFEEVCNRLACCSSFHCHKPSPTKEKKSAQTVRNCMKANYPHRLMLLWSECITWMWKTSKCLCGLHTSQTGHPLSTFGMPRVDVCEKVFQFLPISSSIQPLKQSGTTFQTTINKLINSIFQGPINVFSVLIFILELPFIVTSTKSFACIGNLLLWIS